MAGFNRRDFLKRTGAGAASGAVPGGGVVSKVLAGLGDPAGAIAGAGAVLKNIDLGDFNFFDSFKKIKDGVFKFSKGSLNAVSADLYRFLGLGEKDI